MFFGPRLHSGFSIECLLESEQKPMKAFRFDVHRTHSQDKRERMRKAFSQEFPPWWKTYERPAKDLSGYTITSGSLILKKTWPSRDGERRWKVRERVAKEELLGTFVYIAQPCPTLTYQSYYLDAQIPLMFDMIFAYVCLIRDHKISKQLKKWHLPVGIDSQSKSYCSVKLPYEASGLSTFAICAGVCYPAVPKHQCQGWSTVSLLTYIPASTTYPQSQESQSQLL